VTWFRVDDGFGEHRKVDALGSETPHALCVWLLCGNASARALTDGVVTEAMLARSCSALSQTMRRKAVAALVRVGLWESHPEGWAFKDWLDHQPSRDVVVAEREKARERQRKHRAESAGVSHAVTSAVTDAVTSPSVTRPRPDPSRPDQEERDSDAREASPQKPETLAEALGEPPKPAPSSAGALAAEKAREYVALAMTNRKAVPHRDCSQPMAPLWGTLASFAIKAAKMHGTTWDKILKATIRAWADDQAIVERGYPVSFLAANPNQYLGVAVKGGVL